MDVIQLGSGEERVSYVLSGIGSAGCNIVRGRENSLALSSSEGDFRGISRRFRVDRGLFPAMEYSSHGIKSSGLSEMESQLIPELYGDIFVGFAGLGGRTTSVICPYILDLLKRQVIPSIFSVCLPFSVESTERVKSARRTLDEIMKSASLTIIYKNDYLSEIARDIPIMKSFSLMNSIMWLPVEDLRRVITGEDLDIFFRETGGKTGFFGMGAGSGREKEKRAVAEALRGPWIRDALKIKPNSGIAILHSAGPNIMDLKEIARELEERTGIEKLLVGSIADRMESTKAKLSLILMK